MAERVLRNRIRLCRCIGHVDGLWRSLLMLARLVMDDGLWDEARQCSEEAEALCGWLGCPAGLQEALGFRGWVIVATEAEEDPLPLFAEQLALRRRLGWGSALRAIAGEACQWNHCGLVPRVMEVGTDIARRLGDEEALVEWMSWLSAIHSINEEGLALIAERKALCLRLGDYLGLRDALLSEAYELVVLGRGDEALDVCTEAEAVACSHGVDAHQVAHGVARVLERTHGHLETLLAEREDLDEAAGLLTRQARVACELRVRRGVLRTTANREWVLRRYGRGGRLTLDIDPAELTLLW